MSMETFHQFERGGNMHGNRWKLVAQYKCIRIGIQLWLWNETHAHIPVYICTCIKYISTLHIDLINFKQYSACSGIFDSILLLYSGCPFDFCCILLIGKYRFCILKFSWVKKKEVVIIPPPPRPPSSSDDQMNTSHKMYVSCKMLSHSTE